MIKLTDDQRKVMLQVGRTDSTFEGVPRPVLDELIGLGLVYWQSKDNIYFTDEGERVYTSLTGNHDLRE